MFENEGDRNQENSIREHTSVLPYGKTCSLKITFPQKVSSPQHAREKGFRTLFLGEKHCAERVTKDHTSHLHHWLYIPA